MRILARPGTTFGGHRGKAWELLLSCRTADEFRNRFEPGQYGSDTTAQSFLRWAETAGHVDLSAPTDLDALRAAHASLWARAKCENRTPELAAILREAGEFGELLQELATCRPEDLAA